MIKVVEEVEAMKRMGLLMAILTLIVSAAVNVSAQSGKVKAAQTAPDRNEMSVAQAGQGGYLGVFLGDVNETLAKELKLNETRGAIVGKVKEESPAERSGLRENDVILSYHGQRVESAAQVNRLLTETPPGRVVTLGISRAGVMQNIQVTLGERRSGSSSVFPTDVELMEQEAGRLRVQAEEMRRQMEEEKARQLMEQSEALQKRAEEMRSEIERLSHEGKTQSFSGSRLRASAPLRYHLGVSVLPLNDQLAKFFNVKGSTGLLITEVEAKSAAERAGLKAGDCITAVNGERVTSAADLTRLVSRPGKDGEAGESNLTVVRDRNEQIIKVMPEQREAFPPGFTQRDRAH
jgi:S1-C subfamily serine protease